MKEMKGKEARIMMTESGSCFQAVPFVYEGCSVIVMKTDENARYLKSQPEAQLQLPERAQKMQEATALGWASQKQLDLSRITSLHHMT